MSFKLISQKENGVRLGEVCTPHGVLKTPFFMPVGTVGSVKGVSPDELKALGASIVLSNTYHLYLRPGEGLIKSLGGLHHFMQWDRPILTDSGGYQVFSLGKEKTIQNLKFKIQNDGSRSAAGYTRQTKSLVKITDEGVEFTSHLDGSKHLFTPEKVIQIQLDLGVDILMPLDVCPSGKATKEEVKKACEMTIAWAKRSKIYFDEQIQKSKLKSQNCNSKADNFKSTISRPLLHGIVQGGLYEDLRRWCADELIKLDFDGYSVGGLAVDHETLDMWETVKLMGETLPENKQRYLMGVGTPDDILKATKLGMDMFDCVLPTRMARHGNAYIKSQKSKIKNQNDGEHSVLGHFKLINMLNSKFREDGGVIDDECGCPACSGGFSRAYIAHLLRSKEILGLRLMTLHNLCQYLSLMEEIRAK